MINSATAPSTMAFCCCGEKSDHRFFVRCDLPSIAVSVASRSIATLCPSGVAAMRAPIGMYEGVGPCQGCRAALIRCAGECVRAVGWGAVRGGVPIKGLAGASAVRRAGSAAEACIRAGVCA